jgi:hypothetical protein
MPKKNRIFANTKKVPNWAKFFNDWKNPGGFVFDPDQIEEKPINHPKTESQKNKAVDKTTSYKQMPCNSYEKKT